MSANLIRYLEEISGNAWPAAVVQVVDGWRLRFNWGVTRRANSVWANQVDNQQTLAEKLALVEDFYARRGYPARYQICPANQPADLDAVLAERGYTSDASTSVQIASVATVLDRTGADSVAVVRVTDAFDETWFATYCRIEQFNDRAAQARRDILQRIAPRIGYALLNIDDQPVAVGSAVVERGWAGFFGMATQPQFRRRGAATAILHALAKWSQSYQAAQMYLQVMENNAPARALYEKAGFESLYSYHYREAPIKRLGIGD